MALLLKTLEPLLSTQFCTLAVPFCRPASAKPSAVPSPSRSVASSHVRKPATPLGVVLALLKRRPQMDSSSVKSGSTRAPSVTATPAKPGVVAL